MGHENYYNNEQFDDSRYIESINAIRDERFAELGETVIGDLLLPLPFQSPETLEEDRISLFIQHLLLP